MPGGNQRNDSPDGHARPPGANGHGDIDAGDETARLLQALRDRAPESDADRVWAQIQPRLSETPTPSRHPVARTLRAARGVLRRVARFASVTGAGWGGPLMVSLFAILVVIAMAGSSRV